MIIIIIAKYILCCYFCALIEEEMLLLFLASDLLIYLAFISLTSTAFHYIPFTLLNQVRV